MTKQKGFLKETNYFFGYIILQIHMNIFSDPLGQIYSSLSTRETGLTAEEAEFKQLTFGKNALPDKKKNWMKMLVAEFTSPLVLILFAAVVFLILLPILEHGSIDSHDLVEPIAIVIILVFNGLLGFFQAWKAENTLDALKTLQPHYASVVRDGNVIQIRTEDLVPGDIIHMAEGEKIPADIRLTEAVEVRVNESLLTGESTPVSKNIDLSDEHEMKNVVFSGSTLLSGRASGVVVKTGLDTKIGQIADMITQIERPKSPLQQKLEKLAKKIGIAMILLCVIVFVLATMRDIHWIDALFTAIALAVAAVPEGLPAVMTISLAIGVSVMARKNALVRDLKSVESLGNITVIASDKTGTITQNKMSVEEVFWNGEVFGKKDFEKLDTRVFQIAQNCNDAVLPNIGDPTEIALLEFAQQQEIQTFERIDEVPFSSEKKWMSTTHTIDGKNISLIKGAPEVVLESCEGDVSKILDQAKQMAEKGLRTLAFATEENGVRSFVSLIGLQDPPRPSVKNAIQTAQKAGIRTLMITGDHAITAKSIAAQVGITSEVIEGKDMESFSDEKLADLVRHVSIFARVTPEHKVRICKALQANGEIVAMTGDGVNDAPAITQAEVGISMGKVGTAVARNASDMVLLDDDYSTIVKGVEEGRRIFANIKKAVVFLLATNFAEVMVLLGALMLGLPIPLLPLHILFINLLTDSLPALALATEPAEKDIMEKKPRPKSEGFFTGALGMVSFLGLTVGALVLSFFAISIHHNISIEQSQTLAFVALSLLEMVVIFSLRTHKSLFAFDSFNKWVALAVVVVLILIALAVLTPISGLFGFEMFPAFLWWWIAGGAIVLTLLLEGFKKLSSRW